MNESGIAELLEAQDIVLADKGFPRIATNLEEVGAKLVIPPMGSSVFQFMDEQNAYGYEVAQIRIHVDYIDKVLTVFCYIANNRDDLIKDNNK